MQTNLPAKKMSGVLAATLALLAWSGVAFYGNAQEQPSEKIEIKSPWSNTVNGLRVRLVPTKPQFHENETVEIQLQFQNVTKEKLAVVKPNITPVLGRPKIDKESDCVLVATRIDGEIADSRSRYDGKFDRDRAVHLLQPNETLKVNMKYLRPKYDAPLMQAKKAANEHEVEAWGLLGCEDPGKYEVSGYYRWPAPNGNAKGAWEGKIEFPKVIIEIVEKE